MGSRLCYRDGYPNIGEKLIPGMVIVFPSPFDDHKTRVKLHIEEVDDSGNFVSGRLTREE